MGINQLVAGHFGAAFRPHFDVNHKSRSRLGASGDEVGKRPSMEMKCGTLNFVPMRSMIKLHQGIRVHVEF